jgi:hypothetical protein
MSTQPSTENGNGDSKDPKKPKLDERFKNAYRNILFGQYRGLSMNQAEVQKDAEAVVNSGDAADWEDLYRLELDIVKLEPEALLRRRAWILRNEFAELASAEELKDYYASRPPDPDTGDANTLRADCARMQEELNWRYIVLSVLEQYRGSLTSRVIWSSVIFLAVALLILPGLGDLIGRFAPAAREFLPPINLVMVALIVVPGILGGLVSTLRRIQEAQFGGNADLVLNQFEKGSASVVLSPFLGGIFSFLFYCLVAGGFLSGNLFPKIGFENLLSDTVSAPDFGEYAKLVVWSFISGFSERFVPDQLQVIEKGVSAGEGDSVPKPPPPPAAPRNRQTDPQTPDAPAAPGEPDKAKKIVDK